MHTSKFRHFKFRRRVKTEMHVSVNVFMRASLCVTVRHTATRARARCLGSCSPSAVPLYGSLSVEFTARARGRICMAGAQAGCGPNKGLDALRRDKEEVGVGRPPARRKSELRRQLGCWLTGLGCGQKQGNTSKSRESLLL